MKSFTLKQINQQNSTNDNQTFCLRRDSDSSDVSMNHLETINLCVDQWIHSTIQDAVEKILLSDIELFSNHFTKHIIKSALSIIENDDRVMPNDNEKYFSKAVKNSLELESYEQQQEKSLFNRHYSSSNSNLDEESIDFLMNNITQRIYIDSFDKLRQ